MKIPTAKGRGFPFLLWHIILTSAGVSVRSQSTQAAGMYGPSEIQGAAFHGRIPDLSRVHRFKNRCASRLLPRMKMVSSAVKQWAGPGSGSSLPLRLVASTLMWYF